MSRPEVSTVRQVAAREPANALFDALAEAAAQRAVAILAPRARERRWLVGIQGLASYLGCSHRLARELRAKGLPARKVGKRLYFNVNEVDAFLNREGAA